MNVMVQPKLDGGSAEAFYEDGELLAFVTRGDGNEGDDIVENARKFTGIPLKIHNKSKISVRGEFIIPTEVFKKNYLNVGGDQAPKNARNVGNGLAKAKTLKEGMSYSHLHFVAYDIIVDGINFDSEYEKETYLMGLGFETPFFSVIVENEEELIAVFKEQEENRDKAPYSTDGLVVKINDLEDQGKFDMVDGRPGGQIAWKWASKGVVTKVNDIVWEMGLSGMFCPVAELEPILLGGEVILKRVNLHNCKFMLGLGVKIGCMIEVVRAGDVIPYATRVVS